jgi:hypothetical protein
LFFPWCPYSVPPQKANKACIICNAKETFMLTQTDLEAMDATKYGDEVALVQGLIDNSPLRGAVRSQALMDAQAIVRKARERAKPVGMLETFLEEFGLTTPEGLALMCLAEALLRVPDQETADRLIAEKITSGDWGGRAGKSDSTLVNASVWGLMLTGKVVDVGAEARKDLGAFMHRLTRKAGEPVIRAAVGQAMRIMGEQFVLGRTIEAAIKRGQGAIRKQVLVHKKMQPAMPRPMPKRLKPWARPRTVSGRRKPRVFRLSSARSRPAMKPASASKSMRRSILSFSISPSSPSVMILASAWMLKKQIALSYRSKSSTASPMRQSLQAGTGLVLPYRPIRSAHPRR